MWSLSFGQTAAVDISLASSPSSTLLNLKKSVTVFCSKTLSGSYWPGSFWTARPPFGISEAWWTLTLGWEGAGGGVVHTALKLTPTMRLTYECVSLRWISHLSWPPLASPVCFSHLALAVLNYLQSPEHFLLFPAVRTFAHAIPGAWNALPS